MHKNITVIIPFLNEGNEVYNTVKSIRDTAGNNVDIILINDASADGFNYKSISDMFNTYYIEHSERRGVASSRDEGIKLSSTKYFILLDAHMRFYQNNWSSILLNALTSNSRVLFCCQTISLSIDNNGNVKRNEYSDGTPYGTYIDFFDEDKPLFAKWNRFDPDPNKSIVEVPCVFGASYATSKEYWNYLRGLSGLRSYGADEELISIKVWLEGGKCQLLKDIQIGHVFREVMPYKTLNEDFVYNRLYIAELFLNKEDKYSIFKLMDKVDHNSYKKAMKLLIAQKREIENQKEYYSSIFTRNIEYVLEHNKFLKDRNN